MDMAAWYLSIPDKEFRTLFQLVYFSHLYSIQFQMTEYDFLS